MALFSRSASGIAKTIQSSISLQTRGVYGTVKWYSGRLQYGFITDTEQNDYFFHRADVKFAPDSPAYVRTGEYVEFEIGESERGKIARNITGPNGRVIIKARPLDRDGEGREGREREGREERYQDH